MALILTVLTACREEIEVNPPIDSLETGLTIRIPNPDGAALYGDTRTYGFSETRALDGTSEWGISNLYLVAVPRTIDAGNTVRIFTLKDYESLSSQAYKDYKISIYPGEYRFYVIGNIDSYLVTDDNSSTSLQRLGVENEGQLQQLLLHFRANSSIEPGNIPMACLPKDITVEIGPSKSRDNYVTIGNGSNKIKADLTFLCAKVRYTILFDASRFSSDYGVRRIYFGDQNPYVSNLRQRSPLDKSFATANRDFIKNGDDNASWHLDLARYNYPSNGENYPASRTDALKILDDGTSWADDARRAWQGVAYLPENNDNAPHTILYFPYTIDGRTGLNSPQQIELEGIDRGMMYDVVAKVKTAEAEPMEVTVSVSDWSLQELTYDLHGPYELTLETSKIGVTAGEWTTFWYRSNASPEDISFVFPKYEGVDLYEAMVTKDAGGISYELNDAGDYQIKVTVNGGLSIEQRAAIEKNEVLKSQLSYFELSVGNIHKVIRIDPLILVQN